MTAYSTPDYTRRAIKKYHEKNKDKINLNSKKKIHLNRICFILNQSHLDSKQKLSCIFKSKNYELFKEDDDFIFLIHDSAVIANEFQNYLTQPHTP